MASILRLFALSNPALATIARLNSATRFPSFNGALRGFASKKLAAKNPPGEKRPRRPNAVISLPKRGGTAWILFMKENQGRFKDDKGHYDLSKASSTLSEEWKAMSEEQKKPYFEKQAANSAEYKSKLEAALKRASPDDFARENERRRIANLPLLSDPKMPKKPKSGYILYMAHLRKTVEGFKNLPVTQQAVNGGKMWKELSVEEKKKFEDKATKERQKYIEQMKKYKND
ncbi:high mobility group box domain-containing protein [Jimgerdemannia flammicorona]|uniref:High mobility group box domain-containing protein n=1 Tax=Jimgerdemannia flammicorona TaxID=994334 RepID=A0A433D1X0_9FUNG|nr:high mobility group box domain-containing protein [Jimgerdemannia flammicorona]